MPLRLQRLGFVLGIYVSWRYLRPFFFSELHHSQPRFLVQKHDVWGGIQKQTQVNNIYIICEITI